MMKFLLTALTTIVTSFYLFPVEFTILPSVNTKMAMAGLSVGIVAIQLARQRNSMLDKDVFNLSIFAMVVSLFGLIAVTINETCDYTYASYIISMWVWLGAAYTLITCMRQVHGSVSIDTVCNYLIAACVLQCILAIIIEQNLLFKLWVDTHIAGIGFADMDRLIDSGRLYGIGASFDVAGTRFAAILAIIAYLSIRVSKTEKRKHIIYYLLSFLIIAVVGNMIARTTTIGILIAIGYFIYATELSSLRFNTDYGYFWKTALVISMIFIPIVIVLYNTNPTLHDNIRFAFEGFFSLAEKGRWEVHSNEILQNMYVFPESIKTWVIGNGYFNNPYDTEPFYTGPKYAGYYMNTDVGYLRFIYYFGILGLFAFIAFFLKATQICIRHFPTQRGLFMILVAINFIIWLKVSTDIFVVLAPFLLIGYAESEDCKNACQILKV